MNVQNVKCSLCGQVVSKRQSSALEDLSGRRICKSHLNSEPGPSPLEIVVGTQQYLVWQALLEIRVASFYSTTPHITAYLELQDAKKRKGFTPAMIGVLEREASVMRNPIDDAEVQSIRQVMDLFHPLLCSVLPEEAVQ